MKNNKGIVIILAVSLIAVFLTLTLGIYTFEQLSATKTFAQMNSARNYIKKLSAANIRQFEINKAKDYAITGNSSDLYKGVPILLENPDSYFTSKIKSGSVAASQTSGFWDGDPTYTTCQNLIFLSTPDIYADTSIGGYRIVKIYKVTNNPPTYTVTNTYESPTDPSITVGSFYRVDYEKTIKITGNSTIGITDSYFKLEYSQIMEITSTSPETSVLQANTQTLTVTSVSAP